jgi:hypothetical protein
MTHGKNPYLGDQTHDLKYARGMRVNPYVIVYMIINRLLMRASTDHNRRGNSRARAARRYNSKNAINSIMAAIQGVYYLAYERETGAK